MKFKDSLGVWRDIPTIQGNDGYSPIIKVKTNTAQTYILTIITKEGEFDTPNLKGGGTGGSFNVELVTVLPEVPDESTIYLTPVTGNRRSANINVGGEWFNFDGSIDVDAIVNSEALEQKVLELIEDDSFIQAIITVANSYTDQEVGKVSEALDGKVDVISGKGLSTNDYTTEDKTKLGGIEENATKTEESTVSNWGFTKNQGTVTDIKINGVTYSPNENGLVEGLPTLLTSTDKNSLEKNSNKTDVVGEGDSTSYPSTKGMIDYIDNQGFKTTDTNTTYTLTQDAVDGHKLTFTPSDGEPTTITIPDQSAEFEGDGTTIEVNDGIIKVKDDVFYKVGDVVSNATKAESAANAKNAEKVNGFYIYQNVEADRVLPSADDFNTWNGKQDALAAQTPYTSIGSSTKIPQITTNELGQVTSITEVDAAAGGEGKMDAKNPTGTGSFSLNRKKETDVGNYSFAEGVNGTASGSCSHAEGHMTTASGGYSHAEGFQTTASGGSSHAEGSNAIASGEISHAEGAHTIAAKGYSHAEGLFTSADCNCQHVQGKYSEPDSDKAHIIGGGTSQVSRKNIHTVDWDGNAIYAGTMTATGYFGQGQMSVQSKDGISLSDTMDLDSCVEPGTYYCNGGVEATNLQHCPYKNGNFKLFVIRNTYNEETSQWFGSQILVGGDGSIYSRAHTYSAAGEDLWYAWKLVSRHIGTNKTKTVTVSGSFTPFTGHITNSSQTICVTVPMAILTEYVTAPTVTVSAKDMQMRTIQGYGVPTSATATTFNSNIGTLSVDSVNIEAGTVGVKLVSNSAFCTWSGSAATTTKITNNTPISLIGEFTFTIKSND